MRGGGILLQFHQLYVPNKQKLELLNNHILLNTPLARHLLELLCLVLRIPSPHSPPPTKTKSRQHGLI